jgi:putative DNA primase/helicase
LIKTLESRSEILEYLSKKNASKTDAEILKTLANLPQLEYDRLRKSEAKKLGIQLSTLDDEVQKLRPKSEQDESLPFPITEPFHQSVQVASVLDELVATIRRYIILEPHQADCIALWVTFTWLTDVVQISPLLLINAPERACGKSQLLDLVARLVARPLPVANCSSAALFRSIQLWSPTLTIDEADTFFSENIELAGLINAGHSRANAFVLRTVGEDHTPTRLSVWSAKALAGIQLEKHLPSPTMSRGLVINLRRKLPDEKIERLRHADVSCFTLLASKLARLAQDCSKSIAEARPSLPESLDDRSQDNWDPLFAIASLASGVWIDRATNAALMLAAADFDNTSTGGELLGDIRNIFDSKSFLKISFKDLLAKLTEDDELLWSTYNRGKPLTARQITKRLAAFGIKSKTIRLGSEAPKGYDLDQFAEAFNRYLPDSTVKVVTTVARSQPPPELGLTVNDDIVVTEYGGHKSGVVIKEARVDAGRDRVTSVTAFSGTAAKEVESESI